MSVAYQLRPWTSVVQPHEDIRAGNLELSSYAADLGGVERNDPAVPGLYRDPREFFRTTFPSRSLRRLLEDVLRSLGGEPGDRVLQLRTPFGGGKTHALLALYHLIRSRALIDPRDIEGLPDPGPSARVVVLPCFDLDPHAPRVVDGHTLRTLWGELGWRLDGEGGYAKVQAQDESWSAPAGDPLRALIGRRPTLILLDEVLTYVVRAGGESGQEGRRGQVLAFLQALTQVVSSLPNAVLVYSLQASVGEAAGDEGLLQELDHLVTRVDAKREPVSEDEVLRVVQRRLFPSFGQDASHLQTARDVAQAYGIAYERVRMSLAETESDKRAASVEAERFEQRIVDAYPFHPSLLDLMFHRWGSLPSYQRTRGALQFLATVVHALLQPGASPGPLIGPGDADFGNEQVRGAFFSQVGEREQYSSVIHADVAGEGARAREIDRRFAHDAPGLSHLRLGTRAATAIMLYSFGARQGEERGVLEGDLVQSLIAPDVERPIVVTCLKDLLEQLLYLHYTGRRYRFEPRPNLNLLIAEEEKRIEIDEVAARIHGLLETDLAQGSAARSVLWPPDAGAIPDRVPIFHVVYLGPDAADRPVDEQRASVQQLLEHGRSGRREYQNALAFALPGRQALDEARRAGREAIAIEAVQREVRSRRITVEKEQSQQLDERLSGTTARLRGAVERLYETVLIPIPERDEQHPYRLEAFDLRGQVSSVRTIQGRVLEALRTAVFDSVTPARLVTLCGLGTDRDFVSAAEIAKWFYSYFDFPKLLSDRALRSAIAMGAGDVLGYVAGGRIEDGDLIAPRPDLVQAGATIPPDEVDLAGDAFVTTPALARRLRGDGAGTGSPVGEMPQGTAPARPAPSLGSSLAPTPLALGGRHYRLRARLDATQLFRIIPALQNLADKASVFSASLDLDVEAAEQLTPSWLRNAVDEHLDEAGVTADTELR